MKKKILVTGCCGFIGFHLCEKLLLKKLKIYGVDNLSAKDKSLQMKRLSILKKNKNFKFVKFDLSKSKIKKKLNKNFNTIIHLAARPGVRESFSKPEIYNKNNILAFFNTLNYAKETNVRLFIYASSSSIYGDMQKKKIGITESGVPSIPLSFYALSKKINEMMAEFYSKVYNIKTVGLRFFSVYGPFGRSDMAYYKFPLNVLNNKKILLNNYGNDYRDFTHVNDITNGICNLIFFNNKLKQNTILNFGSNKPIKILNLLKIIEEKFKIRVRYRNLSKNNLDPKVTNADIRHSQKIAGYSSSINFRKGYSNFLDWFLKYHNK